MGDNKFDIKNVSTAVRLASKFFKKMQEHVEDNSIPKDVSAFAKSFFTNTTRGGYVLAQTIDKAKKPTTIQQTDGNGGGKRKPNSKEQQGQKKPRKEFSDKSLKMGLFHVKKGAPASKALLDKRMLKDDAGICMDFCSHEKKCNYPHQLCRNRKHYTNWKNAPNYNKVTLLKHMDSLGLMWLDAETFKKHKIVVTPEFAHLPGDAMGPKQKVAQKSTYLFVVLQISHSISY